MRKLLLIIPFAFVITACGAPTVEELVADPELLKATIAECLELSPSDVVDSEACANVQAANMQLINGMAQDSLKKLGL